MRFLLCVLAMAAIAGSAIAQPAEAPETPAVARLAPGAVAKPVSLARVKAGMQPNQAVGSYDTIPCLGLVPVAWKQIAGKFLNMRGIFREELKAAGFMPDSDPGNMFADQQASQTDLQVGALFKNASMVGCQGPIHTNSKVTLDVEWQIYSSLRREVLATVETHETGLQVKRTDSTDPGRSVYQLAFAANVRGLLANETFRKLVTEPEAAIPNGTVAGGPLTPIRLTGETTHATSISDAVGSVVVVFAGESFGSGVLVSSDGYLLTNHHVVGATTQVKIRWSDGFETTGQVIRSDKRRDVALIKTEPRGRTALAINRSVPAAGTQVYAIGTPLDPKLQSTVTRGIVSASRIVDGFSFIQSDTPVTHGNSGGPLLDETGAVVGLTDWGVPSEKGSTLNFFIPIGDALDFLALKTGN
ncbi:MAG TPA: trypsin-like peptidase domain-containing protein [Phenylobacterium sp.]|uniref:S1C family serine protease n=1 Tax=Phenylobacterium sp. TaxID=1871053 RepID=UPI002D614960|nr:trypsin-like peptidase domain-containing protein [Phenylobacterium sp.]HZZ67840.1 trypsin-like peptidase domain-containing protein [Phenylobacterium sp.]